MEWYSFRYKQPHIGEKILVIKTTWTSYKIFFATYTGRKCTDSIGMCVVELCNLQPYLKDKKYMPIISCFDSLNTYWARLN